MTKLDEKALTRPIIGIENRTAAEVFDIMCDRIIRSALVDPVADEAGGQQRPATGVVCASEGCENTAAVRFESGGVGSEYCPSCYGNILNLQQRPAEAEKKP